MSNSLSNNDYLIEIDNKKGANRLLFCTWMYLSPIAWIATEGVCTWQEMFLHLCAFLSSQIVRVLTPDRRAPEMFPTFLGIPYILYVKAIEGIYVWQSI